MATPTVPNALESFSLGLLRHKCILLISPDPWEGLQMSKHHWAGALAARGNRVLWLDAPGTRPMAGKNMPVEHFVQSHWLRGANRLPARVQRWYSAHEVKRIEALARTHVDLIWSFDTTRLLHLPKQGRTIIRHPVDLFMLDAGADAFRDADLVLTSSTPILHKVSTLVGDMKTLMIGHGLDPRWFRVHRTPAPITSRRPVVGYAGNMSISYLDWEVIAAEVDQHPEVDFRFIGPCTPEPDLAAYRRVRNAQNTTFTGLLGKEAMIYALQQSDVLLLCYRADQEPEQLSNPHKMLEYLATGKPIVASYTSEYAATPGNLLYMARERWEHPLLLACVLKTEAVAPDPALQQARIALAKAANMEVLLDRVEQALHQAWNIRA